MTLSPCPVKATSPPRGFTLIEVLVVLAILGVLFAFLSPLHRGVGARHAARHTQCKNNLKQIGLALHNYHDTYGAFPPVYTVDADGKPLHSWRTLLLPYMDQQPLYNRIDFTKPWDDPVNVAALKDHPWPYPYYLCPEVKGQQDHTTYMAVVTPQSCLRRGASCSLKDITDGTSNTLLVIEVDAEHAVPWMSPNDVDEALLLGFGAKSKMSHTGGWHALLADGSVRFLSINLPAEQRHALVTIDGKDTVGEF